MNKSICFLSYAREDAEEAQKIYRALISKGIEIWFDQESLNPGAKWKAEINRAMRNSRYFIALLSQHSVSKKGFVQKEIKEAIEISKEYPDDEVYIIPVRLDDCRPSNEIFNELNWLNLFEDYSRGMDKLQEFLRVEMQKDKMQANSPEKIETSLINFNGIYQAEGPDSYYYYLRFYNDGVVLSVSTSGNPIQVSKWFNREHVHSSRGIYEINGEFIKFSCTSSQGAINYEGKVFEGNILLKVHSLINGNKTNKKYELKLI